MALAADPRQDRRAFAKDWAGIGIFRFDPDGKIVEHRDVLQVVPAACAHENTMF